jgi:hypothetical protein
MTQLDAKLLCTAKAHTTGGRDDGAIERPAPTALHRHRFLTAAATALVATQIGSARAQPTSNASFGPLKQIDAGVLNIGYAEAGPADGRAVILLHGWPYDIHSFVDVAPALAAAGYRVIVPHLRGHGTTRFLSSSTFRNGQQAVVALDIVALMGRTRNPEGDPRRLRLGRAHCRHHRRAVAGALQGHRLGQRLSDQQPRIQPDAAAGAGRMGLVVPILLRDRARPRRPRG